MKTLYLNCFSGISGDMFLGAALDLGVPITDLQTAVDQLHLPENPRILLERQSRCSISGIKADIDYQASPTHDSNQDQHHHHARHLKDIRQLIQKSTLSEFVKQRSIGIFTRIAEAEAKIHGTTPDAIHFHEVAGIDSIVDIVCAAFIIETLQVDTIFASIPVEGTGTIHCQHGHYPIPAPATWAILNQAAIPFKQIEIDSELITPTGAAILAEFVKAWGPLETFTIEKTGYGLGQRNFKDHPNALRVSLGHTVSTSTNAPSSSPLNKDTVTQLTTNLDDLSSENLAHLATQLMNHGALDVAFIPLLMKKGRPAYQLQILTQKDAHEPLAEMVFRETTALGLRIEHIERIKLKRNQQSVITPYGEVKVKLGYLGEERIHITPEFDDCQALALKHNLPLKEIQQAAMQSFGAS
ncbi:MAG: nickel pincer cofactor biosynthesis protein LarC [Verrucomicrobiota bacterium]